MRTTRYNGFFEEYNILHFMGERKKGLALFDSETDGEDFQTIQREMWRFHLVLDEGGFKRFLMFLPLGLCGGLWFLLLFNIVLYFFSEDITNEGLIELFSGRFLFNLVISLFLLNIYPYFLRMLGHKYAYFDRVKQTVSFSFDVGSDELDEFGNQCFPWLDIEAEIFEQIGDMGVPRFFVRLVHKDRDKYPKVNLCMDVVGIQNSAMYCHLRWELIIRHMDNTKPLPDIPIYELDRSKDDLTREFDKQNNRPKLFWAGFSLGEQSRLKRLYEEDAADFNFTYGPEREEIVKPWLKWKPDLTQEQVNKKQSFIKVALIQILTGLP
ncbi:hypothetical protein KIJ96_21835 (plasmid) [Pseudoalteromonas piscicida]|uniref:hypothetical protein n=1 Tax=Pseudoalteromonas piscicida TaxID=43662 RepID=UPI001D0A1774|nr:hypothetical protein [Pseudoalteromonas piscicida]UDM63595.1 hypothetical protein KIJ96_21835 [Pseudoalteromonas piscicida]